MSDCGVCIGTSDYDAPEWSNTDIVKACRKPFLCCECKREVPKGKPYEKSVMKYEGDFYTYRTCMDCVNIRDGLRCGQGFLCESLWDDITEVFDQITTGCLAKIETASAKAYFVERWRKWKGLESVPER
jgi:hypothetical protein